MLAQAEVCEMQENAGSLETRVARLEADVSHIRSDVSLLQVDVRDFRKTMDVKLDALDKKFEGKLDALDQKFDTKFDSLAEKIGELKVWALLVLGGGGLSMIGRALHWF